jgi:hypothetical protein
VAYFTCFRTDHFCERGRNAVMGDKTLDELRKGIYSANAQTVLSMYVPELKTEQEIVEIWTIRAGMGRIRR